MIKETRKNLALICLNTKFLKRFGKLFADSLDMFFVDINDMLEYNLVNKEMLDTCGLDYFNDQQHKIVEEISGYENACIIGSFSVINNKDNWRKLKKNCVLIYLQFDDESLKKLNEKVLFQNGSINLNKNLIAADIEDKIAVKISDIIVKMAKGDEKNIKHIKQEILKFYKKNV